MTEIGKALAADARRRPRRRGCARRSRRIAPTTGSSLSSARARAASGRARPASSCRGAPPRWRRRSASRSDHGVAVVPFGAGSGVVGGATPPSGSLVVDLRAMDRLLELNETALYACAEAGMMGGAYEAALIARGYSTRPLPAVDRRSRRSAAGWRPAPRASSRPATATSRTSASGSRWCCRAARSCASTRCRAPRSARRSATSSSAARAPSASSPRSTLRVHPLPEERALATFAFATMHDGARGRAPHPACRLAAARAARLRPGGDGPPLLGLDDGTIAASSSWSARGPGRWSPPRRPPARASARPWAGPRSAPSPRSTGSKGATRCRRWDFFLDREMLADTIEVAATWDRIDRIYETVVAALAGAPGVILASGHSSHGYPQGTNIYFTFVAEAGRLRARRGGLPRGVGRGAARDARRRRHDLPPPRHRPAARAVARAGAQERVPAAPRPEARARPARPHEPGALIPTA